MSNQAVIDSWFDFWQKTLTDHGLHDKPSQVIKRSPKNTALTLIKHLLNDDNKNRFYKDVYEYRSTEIHFRFIIVTRRAGVAKRQHGGK